MGSSDFSYAAAPVTLSSFNWRNKRVGGTRRTLDALDDDVRYTIT